MTKPCLLLVDKTKSLASLCVACHQQAGLRIVLAKDAQDTVVKLRTERPSVAVIHLEQLWTDGVEVLRNCLTICPSLRVIIVGAPGAMSYAVKAMRAGAFDVLPETPEKPKIMDAIMAAFADARAARAGQGSQRETALVGTSATMAQVVARIKAISASNGNVFITGESGTGKALSAAAIHAASHRAKGPFISVKCGGVDDAKLNTVLFGNAHPHVSKTEISVGAIQRARGGTLFLDDICDLSRDMQTKLLHVIEAQTIGPDAAPHRTLGTVRFICSTIQDPEAEIAKEFLRPDLYFRLFVLPLHLPPLRARGEDVLDLAEMFLRRINKEEQKSFTTLSQDARAALLRYGWPGNVRQLINVLRHAIVLNEGAVLTASMLPLSVVRAPCSNTQCDPSNLVAHDLLGRSMTDVERQVIEANIQAQGGSITKAAEILGVSPSTIYRKREAWR